MSDLTTPLPTVNSGDEEKVIHVNRRESQAISLAKTEEARISVSSAQPRLVRAKSNRTVTKPANFPWRTFVVGCILFVSSIVIFVISMYVKQSAKVFFFIIAVITVIPGLYAIIVVLLTYAGCPGCSYRLIPYFDRRRNLNL